MVTSLWGGRSGERRSPSPSPTTVTRTPLQTPPPGTPETPRDDQKGHRRNHSDPDRFGKQKKHARCGLCVANDAVAEEAVTDDEGPARAADAWRAGLKAAAILGQGSFGRVHLVTGPEGGPAKYALKSVATASLSTPKKREHARAERAALELLRGHPNVLRLEAAWEAPGALHLVTECAWGGELFRHLQRRKRFAGAEVRFISGELGAALLHCHAKKVAYRDVKPENVLFGARGHVLLADFGLSKLLPADMPDDRFRVSGCASLCGTPEYMAPEVLDRVPYGSAVDWWALGMLAAELLTGLPPWYTEDRVELFRRIRRAPLEAKHLVCRDPSARRDPLQRETAVFCERLLRRDASQRLTDAGVAGHQYFAFCGHDLAALRQREPPFNPMREGEDPGPASQDLGLPAPPTVKPPRAPRLLLSRNALAKNFDAAGAAMDALSADQIALAVAHAVAPPPPPPSDADASPGLSEDYFPNWSYP